MTAYDVRISDWSSDVCSSDLAELRLESSGRCFRYKGTAHYKSCRSSTSPSSAEWADQQQASSASSGSHSSARLWQQSFARKSIRPRSASISARWKIGKASSRESVCQYV